jgi:Ca2+-binding RTX toxin-like protein
MGSGLNVQSGPGNDTLSGVTTRNVQSVLAGGAGNDTYIISTDYASAYASFGSDYAYIYYSYPRIIENPGNGYDTVYTDGAISSDLEELIYTGTLPFDGAGGSSANVIRGGPANDRLSGGDGADVLYSYGGSDTFFASADGAVDTFYGGDGNDVYRTDDARDIIIELPGEGNSDRVITAANAFTLSANVEFLQFSGTGNFAGTGSDDANVIYGGGGDDRLDGAGGDDTLVGGAEMTRFMAAAEPTR